MTGPDGGQQSTAADATASFLVSLYLVLLAFFILLSVISSFDERKSAGVLQSVTDRLGPGRLPDAAELRDGNAEALRVAADLRRELRRAFDAAMPGARFGMSQAGRVMEAVIPVPLLFEGGASEPRAGSDMLLRRIARAVTAAVPAVRCRIEVVLRGASVATLTSDTLTVRRADALARGLRRAGLPDAGILAGTEAATAAEVRFVFRLVSDEAAAGR